MNRKTTFLATLACLLVLPQAGFAKELGTQPQADLTQVTARHQQQQPEPLPETPVLLPGPPREQQSDREQVGDPAKPQPLLQIMTGTIAREDGKYVLKALDNKTYQIDDQDKAKHYEGKEVKIVGRLEVETNTIRVQSVEPMS